MILTLLDLRGLNTKMYRVYYTSAKDYDLSSNFYGVILNTYEPNNSNIFATAWPLVKIDLSLKMAGHATVNKAQSLRGH
jgi:hypothetical protein